jgi:hypothetical protein
MAMIGNVSWGDAAAMPVEISAPNPS